MKSQFVILKSNLTIRYLSYYLFRFFRRIQFNSNYIFIITKITLRSKTIITLGNKEVINISDRSEITRYVHEIKTKFLVLSKEYIQKKNKKKNEILTIFYMETTEDEYNKYLESLFSK